MNSRWHCTEVDATGKAVSDASSRRLTVLTNQLGETCGTLPQPLVPAVVRPIVGYFSGERENQTVVTGFDVLYGGANYTSAPIR